MSLNVPSMYRKPLFVIFTIGFGLLTFEMYDFRRISQVVTNRIGPQFVMKKQDRERIKVLTEFDRTNAESLLNYRQWYQLIDSIAERKPKAILLFHDFSHERWQKFSLGWRPKLNDVPLVGVLPKVSVNAEEQNFNLQHYEFQPQQKNHTSWDESAFKDLSQELKRSPIVWGHAEFAHLGQMYTFLRVGKNWIGNVSIFGSDLVKVRRESLLIDGQEFDFDDNAMMMARPRWGNIFVRERYRDLGRIFRASEEEAFSSSIKPGDVVVLVPSEAFIDTQRQGQIIGVLDGLQRREWRHESYAGWSLLILSGVVLLAISLMLPWNYLAVVSGTIFVSTTVIGIVCQYQNLFIDWFHPALTLAFLCLGSTYGFFFGSQRQKELLWSALQDSVDDDFKPKIIEKYLRGDLSFEEQICTIVRIEPVNVFDPNKSADLNVFNNHQKRYMERISELLRGSGALLVKETHGVVGVFGSYITADDVQHPLTAMEIVQEILDITFSSLRNHARDNSLPESYPLRISLHTGPLTVGMETLSDSFKLVCQGRSMALSHLLCAGGTPFHVIISESSLQYLRNHKVELTRIHAKSLAAPDSDDLLSAYELEVLHAEPNELKEINLYFNKLCSRFRQHDRIAIDLKKPVDFVMGDEHAILVNFSEDGFLLKMDRFLGVGVKLTGLIRTIDQRAEEELLDYGVDYIEVEVRWSEAEKEDYMHGVKILNLDATQRDIMTNLLKSYSRKDEQVA